MGVQSVGSVQIPTVWVQTPSQPLPSCSTWTSVTASPRLRCPICAAARGCLSCGMSLCAQQVHPPVVLWVHKPEPVLRAPL